MPALEAPYGAEGTRCGNQCSGSDGKRSTNTYLVWTITRHTCRKHNTSLYALLYERPRRTARRVKAPIQIHAPQLIEFLGRKVQRGFVLGAPGVAYHTVQGAGLREDRVDGGLYRVFFCDVGLDGEELVGVFL
jgi:hypothetical protein